MGASVFGASGGLFGGALSGNQNYSFNRDNGSILMAYTDFKNLYEATNNVYRYMTTLKSFKTPENNSMANYTVKDISVAGEYMVGAENKIRFYFQLGDAIFTMTEAEFTEIVKVVRDIKNRWDKIESTG